MSKILIVEDNPESRYMLEQLLASRGHQIISAEDGEDALRLARQDPPEVIISDIMMPVMNGFRLCREVKKDSNLRNIPFIFYTATFTEKTDEKLAMNLGASRFILKPTEGEQFIRMLDEVLDEHRQGILQVPEKPLEDEQTLLEMYDDSIALKLSKTVEKLQNEREMLIKSERRLKEAQELAHIGHWELDVKNNFLEWSDEIYRILGLKPQEIDATYEAFMAAVHPDDRVFVAQAHKNSLAKKTQCDIECRVLLKDGTIKYVNERFQTIYDDDGMPTCSIGTIQDITECKLMEKVLRESESQYRSIFNSAIDSFLIFDLDGNIVEANPQACKIYGYTYEEFIKLSGKDIVHPDYHYLFEKFKKDVQAISEFHAESVDIRKDGTMFDVEVKGGIFDYKGKPHLLAVIRDITERKEAEEVLREAYDIINKSSSVAFTWKNQEGWPVEFVSENVERLFGYTAEEFITGDVNYVDCIHPDDLGQVAMEVAEFSTKAETAEFTHEPYRIIARDGSEKIIDDWTYIVRDNDGRITHYKGVVEDITERKRAEEALRQSEHELSIRNRINEIFLIIPDEEMYGKVLTVILEVMESKYGIFGYIDENGAWVCPSMTRGVWDECRITDKTIIFTRDQWGGLWGRAMAEKKTICSNKTFIVPRGHIPITRALDVPIIYQGELIGNILVGDKETDYNEKDIQVLEDIAANLATVLYSRLKIEKQEREKKQLEARFHHAQKMEAIGVLAGGVAHDFNNLLTTIIGNAQITLDGLSKDDPLWEDIGEIIKAGQKGAVLARQLLTFSRKEIFHPEILDLNEVVHDMDKLLRRLIRENIELETVLSPGLWKVEADPGQIEQVIMNLVINSRDAMLEGGKLTIETANVNLDETYFSVREMEGLPGSYVMLAVTDTGPDMDEETLSRMFEPFFTTKERGAGTGLGLSTVYGIVKQSKGYIWPYSEHGMGTTMKMYLPRAEGVRAAIPEKEMPEEEVGGSEVVLLVEDEESLRKLAVKSLRKAGYDVLMAANGEEALRVSEEFEGEIHLLLTDVVMPVMGGRELAERMVALHPEIKVVYMSGYPGKALSHNDILKPGTDYFQKPFTPESLCRKVREALDRQTE